METNIIIIYINAKNREMSIVDRSHSRSSPPKVGLTRLMGQMKRERDVQRRWLR